MRRSGRESFVAVMEPADLWESDDRARARRLHAAGFGAILRERQVCVVVPENLSLQFIPSGLPTGPGFGLPHFILFTDWASDPFGSRPRASVYHSLPAEHGAGAC